MKSKDIAHDGSIYDKIGSGYARTRQEDPRIYDLIVKSLGDSTSVVNVGAGAGSYEPRHLKVLAIEPSEVMARQRRPDAGLVIKATADNLPLHAKTFDAAMSVVSLHHWYPKQEKGIKEMCRVARKRIVIVTFDPRVCEKMWLMSDYLRETAELDNQIFPLPEMICEWIGGQTQVDVVPISRDTPDWNLMSFWAHPERVLDANARAATSGFARQPPEVIERVVHGVEQDLKSGKWDEKYGHLRKLTEYDAGLRLISATLS